MVEGYQNFKGNLLPLGESTFLHDMVPEQLSSLTMITRNGNSYIVMVTYLHQSTALSYSIHLHLSRQYWQMLSLEKQSFMFLDVKCVFQLCGSHYNTETIVTAW
jgi:hypothetical protein